MPSLAQSSMSGLKFRSSICLQHTAQLLERRAHLRFDRAYGAAPQLRDLLIRQSAVLPQEKHGLLFRTQLQEGDAELLQGFFVRDLVDRRRLDRGFWRACQRPGAPAPGTALQVL